MKPAPGDRFLITHNIGCVGNESCLYQKGNKMNFGLYLCARLEEIKNTSSVPQ